MLRLAILLTFVFVWDIINTYISLCFKGVESMKIVIIGLGTMGRNVLGNLSCDEHTITIIDEDKDKIERLIEKYDVQGVVGNGASIDIQKEAGMKDADLAIIMTHGDELNVFACMVAKKLGVKNPI